MELYKKRAWKRTTTKASYVYALCDPETMVPFYVGVTSQPQQRLSFHLSEARRMKKHGKGYERCDAKNETVRSILSRCFVPCMAILETTTVAMEKQAEKRWSAALASKGHEIINIRTLDVGRRELYSAVRLNYRLVELAQMAAGLLESDDCDARKQVAAGLRERIAEADKMIESL